MKCYDCNNNLERIPYEKKYGIKCPNHHCILFIDNDRIYEYGLRFSYKDKKYLIFSNENKTALNIFLEKDIFKRIIEINGFTDLEVKNNKIDISFAIRLLKLKVFI